MNGLVKHAVASQPVRATAVAAAARGALGAVALATMLVASVVLGAGASGQRLYFFVPGARPPFPDWMRGPLAHLGLRLDPHDGAVLLVVLFACYLVVVACAEQIPARLAIAAIVALHAVFLLAPPLFSADVFGYIDYARLGVIHGLDPYTHGARAAPADYAARFVRWHDIPTPYGPLFTLASYGLAHLSVAVALWVYKAVAAIAGLGCVALVWRLALRTGQQPRRAAMLVGLNPLFVVYGVGGAHNDLLVQLLVLGAIACMLREREREREGAAGTQIALAVLMKASAGLVAPFLIAGALRPARALTAALAAGAAVGLAGLAILGEHEFRFAAQIFTQQELVALYSVPNQLGVLLGQDGLTTPVRAAFTAAFLLTVVWLLIRAWRGASWIACAGWATLAALMTSAWLTPWYVVWLLPLAAIAPSRPLRLATLTFCAYVVATRVAYYL